MRLRTKFAALAVTAGVAVTATAAFGYFTTSGKGIGSAKVGTDTPWNVTSSNTTNFALTPGGPIDNISIEVANDSTGHQLLSSILVKVANADGTDWDGPGNCSAADFAVGGEDGGATYTITLDTPEDLAAGEIHTDSVSLQMVDRDADQNACRLASVPLYFYAR